jgi:hypothetical protein
MAILEMARAGPRGGAETGSRNAAFAGAFQATVANSEIAQDDLTLSPADLWLASGRLNECEMALIDREPVASDEPMHSQLSARGVRWTASLFYEPVVFLPGDRFEFARHVGDADAAVVAVVFPAPDDLGQSLDLARRTRKPAGWRSGSAVSRCSASTTFMAGA